MGDLRTTGRPAAPPDLHFYVAHPRRAVPALRALDVRPRAGRWSEIGYGKAVPVQWVGTKQGGSVIEIGAWRSGESFMVRVWGEGRNRGLSEKALESRGNRNCATF